ncbi:MAG: DsbA family protein [Solirubrobacterales bacterium]
MSSRKEQKEQARLEREAKQQELAAQAQRSRRMKVIGGVLGIAAIAVLVAVVISTSGSGGGTATNAEVDEINSQLAGIPQNGITLGEENAPATMVEFADLKCPFCAEFATDGLPTIIEDYVKSGKVKIEFRNLTFLDQATEGTDDSTNAAKFAQATGLQNKLWNFVDLFYAQQEAENTVFATEEFLRNVGSQVPGLDVDKAWADRDDPKVQEELDLADEIFNREGLSGTPSFLVGPTDGTLEQISINDLSDPTPLINAIEAAQE